MRCLPRLVTVAVVSALALAACTDPPSGNLNLILTLPPEGDLRPTGMTTVAIGVRKADGSENVTTTPLDGTTFSAGEVIKGEPITLDVELRDNGARLIGFGRLDEPVIPEATEQSVTIPVRKPMVYVSAGAVVHTIDTTLDALDPKYQGTIAASIPELAAAKLVVPIDGTELAALTATSVARVSTADHQPIGTRIDLEHGTVVDAVTVPGQRRLVVATTLGLAVVDVDAGAVIRLPLAQTPDRIAIGGSLEAGFSAYVLTGRVAAPVAAETCTGTSQLVAVALDAPTEQPVVISSTLPLSDIAAAGAAVFGADPCAGEVKRLDAGEPAVSLTVARASALAIEGNRLWATGTLIQDGARVLLASIQLDGNNPKQVQLPVKTEVMTYDLDERNELSINMAADTAVAVDLAVLPGSQSVALIARMDSRRTSRFDQFGEEVVPAMTAIVHDLVIADANTGAVVQRIRARCELDVEFRPPAGAEFQSWSCIEIIGAEAPAGGEMVPAALGALFGGR